MKVGAEGSSGFSRLDWPASELLRDTERAHNGASGEISELLREARCAHAEARRPWTQSLLHQLMKMVSASLSDAGQTFAGPGEASRRR